MLINAYCIGTTYELPNEEIRLFNEPVFSLGYETFKANVQDLYKKHFQQIINTNPEPRSLVIGTLKVMSTTFFRNVGFFDPEHGTLQVNEDLNDFPISPLLLDSKDFIQLIEPYLPTAEEDNALWLEWSYAVQMRGDDYFD